MNTYITQLYQYRSGANAPSTKNSSGFYLADNRPGSIAQRKMSKDLSSQGPVRNNAVHVSAPGPHFTIQFGKDKEKRPSFRSNVKKMRKYAIQVLNGKQFDMAHRMSYSDIADIVLDDTTSDDALKNLIRDLTIPKRNFGKIKKGDTAYYYLAMSVRTKRKMLLKILNSSPYNLRPGDPSTNRGIGAKGDLHYVKTKPGLTRTLTPQSQALEKWIANNKGESSDMMTGVEYSAFEGGLVNTLPQTKS